MSSLIKHKNTTLKSCLKNGYDNFLLSFSPTLAEITGLSGYDFVVVDMELEASGIPQALSCLHALAASNTPAIIHVPYCDPVWVKKALDIDPRENQVGDKVQKGQVICIIEAMKLMNEIEADQSGTIVDIIAEDGKPVSLDTPLLVIEP